MGRFGPPPKPVASAPSTRRPLAVVETNPRRNRGVAESSRGAAEEVDGSVSTSPQSKRAQQSKLDAARAVGYRESLLMQLNALVLHWPTGKPTAEAVRLLANLSKEMREAGLNCVEKIVAWVLASSDPATGPNPFLWNGSDYLLKMFNDLDFVSKALGKKAWGVGNFCRGNPLLLSDEEIAGRGARGRAHSSRVRAACMVLVDVLRRHGIVGNGDQQPPAALNVSDATTKRVARPSRGSSSPRMNNAGTKPHVAPAPSTGRGGDHARGPQGQQRRGPTSKQPTKPTAHITSAVSKPSSSAAKSKEKGLGDHRNPSSEQASREQLSHEAGGKEKEEAAVKLQAVQRQRAAAQTYAENKQHKEGEEAKAQLTREDNERKEQHSAAAKLQATQRGKRARGEVAAKKRQKRALEGEEEEHRAARKLQGQLRGHQAKLRVRKMKADRMSPKLTEGTDVLESKANEEEEEVEEEEDEEEGSGYDDEEYEDDAEEEYDDEDEEVAMVEKEEEVIGVPSSADGAKKSSLSDWQEVRMLGEGNFGEVVEVVHVTSKQRGAMKRFKGAAADDDDETAAYIVTTQRREVDLCLKLQHPGVVKLLAALTPIGSDAPRLVFEFMPQNLLEAIHSQPDTRLEPEKVRCLLAQLCTALAYIHRLRIAHRDLKPENLLVDDWASARPVLKLCDFGASRELQEPTSGSSSNSSGGSSDLTNYVGSRWYRAPESLGNRTDYGVEVDVWAAAAIAAEVASGVNLFSGDDESAVYVSIASLVGPPPRNEQRILEAHDLILAKGFQASRSLTKPVDHSHGLGASGLDLVMRMLQWQPLKRPSMAECLDHRYFKDRDDDNRKSTPRSLDASVADEVSMSDLEAEHIGEEVGDDPEDKSAGAPKEHTMQELEERDSKVSAATEPGVALLRPVKEVAALLHERIGGPTNRVAIVASRSQALAKCVEVLGSEESVRGEPVLLDAYYPSPFGTKAVGGVSVEEGEGQGPRKELFALVSQQLQEPWRVVEGAKATVHLSFTPGRATADVEGPLPDELLVGDRLLLDVGASEAAVTVLAQDGRALRVDRPFEEEGVRIAARRQRQATPTLSYVQGSESVWPNGQIMEGPSSVAHFRAVGTLLGLCVSNHCCMELALPPLFFAALINAAWKPSLSAVLELDPSFQTTVSAVEKMDVEQFAGLEDDGGSSRSSKKSLAQRKADYLETAVADFFAPFTSWQLPLLRAGFTAALGPSSPLDGITPAELRAVICGASSDKSDKDDFDLRAVFRVKEDAALAGELGAAFWEVVNALPAQTKRKVVLFVTGVSQLPDPSAEELFTIEVPFTCFGLDDYRKALLTVPTAHTCANVLELPDYWASLLKLEGGVPTPELRSRLRKLLLEKVTVAVENASGGYGLDGLTRGDNEDALSEQPPVASNERADDNIEECGDELSSSGVPSIPGLDEDEGLNASSGSGSRSARGATQLSPPRNEAPGSPDDEYGEDSYDDFEDDFEEEEIS